MTWLTPPLVWFEIVVLALIGCCIYRFSRHRGSRIAALRDWLAYVAISVALVVVIVVAAIYGPEKSPIDAKSIAFTVNTVFVLSYTLKVVRPLWTKRKLWAVIPCLILLHGIIGWVAIPESSGFHWLYVPVHMGEIWGCSDWNSVGLRYTPSADGQADLLKHRHYTH